MSVIFLEPQPISNAMNSIALIGPPCPTPQPRHPSSRLGRLVAVSCWIYLVILLGLWLGLSWGDTWWPATLIMFTPRLVLALPVVVLFPAALLLRRAPFPCWASPVSSLWAPSWVAAFPGTVSWALLHAAHTSVC